MRNQNNAGTGQRVYLFIYSQPVDNYCPTAYAYILYCIYSNYVGIKRSFKLITLTKRTGKFQ